MKYTLWYFLFFVLVCMCVLYDTNTRGKSYCDCGSKKVCFCEKAECACPECRTAQTEKIYKLGS